MSSTFSSLKVMAQVPLLSMRSTPVHKFSASRIEETALENHCSNLLLLEADSCLHLLLLTCVFLVFLMVCCNMSSLNPASWLRTVRPMCDGLPAFSPLGGSRHLFQRFPFPMGFTPCVIFVSQRNRACCYASLQEDPLYECGRPCEDLPCECDHSCHTLLCLFFTDLWLQQSPPRRYRPSPSHVYQWGPHSLSGRLLYLQNVNNPALPLPMRIPTTIILKVLFQVSRTPVGGAMLFNHLRYNKILQVGIHVATSLMAVRDVFITGNTRGFAGSVLSSQRDRELKLKNFGKLFENNNIITQEDRPYASTRIFCLWMLL